MPENGGSSSLLSPKQTQEIIEHLELTIYTKSIDIIALISNKYCVNYTVSGINKWLHRMGFSYKQPKGVPHKVDLDKQSSFITEYLVVVN